MDVRHAQWTKNAKALLPYLSINIAIILEVSISVLIYVRGRIRKSVCISRSTNGNTFLVFSLQLML